MSHNRVLRININQQEEELEQALYNPIRQEIALAEKTKALDFAELVEKELKDISPQVFSAESKSTINNLAKKICLNSDLSIKPIKVIIDKLVPSSINVHHLPREADKKEFNHARATLVLFIEESLLPHIYGLIQAKINGEQKKEALEQAQNDKYIEQFKQLHQSINSHLPIEHQAILKPDDITWLQGLSKNYPLITPNDLIDYLQSRITQHHRSLFNAVTIVTAANSGSNLAPLFSKLISQNFVTEAVKNFPPFIHPKTEYYKKLSDEKTRNQILTLAVDHHFEKLDLQKNTAKAAAKIYDALPILQNKTNKSAILKAIKDHLDLKQENPEQDHIFDYPKVLQIDIFQFAKLVPMPDAHTVQQAQFGRKHSRSVKTPIHGGSSRAPTPLLQEIQLIQPAPLNINIDSNQQEFKRGFKECWAEEKNHHQNSNTFYNEGYLIAQKILAETKDKETPEAIATTAFKTWERIIDINKRNKFKRENFLDHQLKIAIAATMQEESKPEDITKDNIEKFKRENPEKSAEILAKARIALKEEDFAEKDAIQETINKLNDSRRKTLSRNAFRSPSTTPNAKGILGRTGSTRDIKAKNPHLRTKSQSFSHKGHGSDSGRVHFAQETHDVQTNVPGSVNTDSPKPQHPKTNKPFRSSIRNSPALAPKDGQTPTSITSPLRRFSLQNSSSPDNLSPNTAKPRPHRAAWPTKSKNPK